MRKKNPSYFQTWSIRTVKPLTPKFALRALAGGLSPNSQEFGQCIASVDHLFGR